MEKNLFQPIIRTASCGVRCWIEDYRKWGGPSAALHQPTSVMGRRKGRPRRTWPAPPTALAPNPQPLCTCPAAPRPPPLLCPPAATPFPTTTSVTLKRDLQFSESHRNLPRPPSFQGAKTKWGINGGRGNESGGKTSSPGAPQNTRASGMENMGRAPRRIVFF